MPCAGADEATFPLPAAPDVQMQAVQMQAALLQQSRCRLRAGKAQMMFEHIHKSGGTTMCMLAIHNSLSMWSCEDNTTTSAPPGSSDYGPHSMCNCNGPDVLRGARGPFQVSTPQQQLQLLQDYKGAVLFFNEGPVADEMLRSEAIQYVTLLRDPVQRYMSHLLHGLEHQGTEQYQRALQVRAACCRSSNCMPTMPPAPLDKDCASPAVLTGAAPSDLPGVQHGPKHDVLPDAAACVNSPQQLCHQSCGAHQSSATHAHSTTVTTRCNLTFHTAYSTPTTWCSTRADPDTAPAPQNVSAAIEADMASGPHYLDNYITRSLAGNMAFALPVGALTQAHAARAIHNLDSFTLVLVLEQLDAPAWALLAYSMDLASVPVGQQRSGTNYSSLSIRQGILPGTLQRVREAHALDMQVYAHAVTLHRRNAAAWKLLLHRGQAAAQHKRRSARAELGKSAQHVDRDVLC